MRLYSTIATQFVGDFGLMPSLLEHLALDDDRPFLITKLSHIHATMVRIAQHAPRTPG